MRVNKPTTLFLLTWLCFCCISLFATSQKSSTAQAKVITSIKYQGRDIKLNERSLYINARLEQKNLGKYAFRTLQDAAACAKDGTSNDPTIIYLEPDVYWTNNPYDENKENELIGLRLPQANITLIGLADNPEHTIIAGDRGQMAGAIGNWNTIGVGDGFKAYNITFGNYCNLDLIYSRDPTKNHRKRQETITQAQVLTTAHGGRMDKWVFENCRFISFLNVFAAGREPERAYFKNCFFQCTDDAIGSGGMSIFERCRFRFYANHPSWGGSRILQAYLGCSFETVLRDPKANPTIFFAKNNAIFAVVDCHFDGNARRLEWTDILSNQARHYVYHNTLNGEPVMISAGHPELSVELSEESLKAFKIGDQYNIYNLLRGDDDWDPARQKELLNQYGDLAFRLQLNASKTLLDGATGAEVKVSYILYPARTRQETPIKWTVSDPKLLSFVSTGDGALLVKGTNTSEEMKRGYIKGETVSGIVALVYFDVSGIPAPAPRISKALHSSEPSMGKVSADYTLDLQHKRDFSLITWYRARRDDGSDTLQVAVSRMNQPYKDYKLSSGDVGYYLIAEIEPRHETSETGKAVFARSRRIKPNDIGSESLSTDFKNIPTRRNEIIRNGFWTIDTYRPKDLNPDYAWQPAPGDGWAYGEGEVETAGRQGLFTLGRGARLLYTQTRQHRNMHLELELSPQKAAGQGFGSATGQYLDVYTKYDTKRMSGYGLRIERTPAYGNGVLVSLYKYENGIGTPLGPHQYTSAFLPGCQITLSVKDKILSARVTTSSEQQQGQKDSGLAHEVNLSAEINPDASAGFGVQHTGSTGGNRLMLERLRVSYD